MALGGDKALGLGVRADVRPWRCRAAVDRFPSLKAPRLLSILSRDPLRYRVVRQRGSHRKLEADGYPPLTFAFHDADSVPGGMVKKILVDQVGLDEAAARELV
jgi:predicted RNA binding protein YcfA (HicA-like mRNA interferase family)